MNKIPPWAMAPFELLVHAEGHHRKAEDVDKRLALIGFDNAFEVAVSTYMALKPTYKGDRRYGREDFEKVRDGKYAGKLEFVFDEALRRSVQLPFDPQHVLWAHEQRNPQYHEGGGVPEKSALINARSAAVSTFAMLFDIDDVEGAVEQALGAEMPPAPPARDPVYDHLIDERLDFAFIGDIDVVEDMSFAASDILFHLDYEAYKALGSALVNGTFVPREPVDIKDLI